MVEVYYYHIRLYLYHAGIHPLSFVGLQRNDVSFFYMFAVEFAVNLENMFGKVYDVLFVIFSVCIVRRNREIEFVAFLKRG